MAIAKFSREVKSLCISQLDLSRALSRPEIVSDGAVEQTHATKIRTTIGTKRMGWAKRCADPAPQICIQRSHGTAFANLGGDGSGGLNPPGSPVYRDAASYDHLPSRV